MEVDNTTVRQVSEPPLPSSSDSNSETTISPSLCPRPPEETHRLDRSSNNGAPDRIHRFSSANACHPNTSSYNENDNLTATYIQSPEAKKITNISSRDHKDDLLCKDSNENIASKSENKDQVPNLLDLSVQVITSKIIVIQLLYVSYARITSPNNINLSINRINIT